MRGKIKYVTRSEYYKNDFNSVIYGHDSRYTNTYAVLWNDDCVNIDEDEIRSYYDRSRITDNLISELSDELHNVWISYSEDEDGDYWLDDDLDDLI